MKNIKSQKGFSMIELMMVVVIIGILAGVGIPQYQKFQMKAKQSEAKSLLTGMYTAQKAFYAEWSQYYADFNAVGYGLEGNLGYFVGFRSGGVNGPANHPNPTYRNRAGSVFHAGLFCGANCNFANSKSNASHLPGTAVVSGAPGTATHRFVFGAAANLDNDPRRDRWTINSSKQFEQRADWNDLAD